MILKAELEDVNDISHCASSAYSQYISRIGKKPAPMQADFKQHVLREECYVYKLNEHTLAFIIFRMQANHVFIENVAVLPEHSRKGIGKALLNFAESKALQVGLAQSTLYTNVAMTENLQMYGHLGYIETHRTMENGFNRVYFSKALSK